MFKDKIIRYFETSGKINSEETLQLAYKRSCELGIKNVIVASSTGETGLRALEIFRNINVIVIPLVTGHKTPGKQELLEENAKKIKKQGGTIQIAGQAFSGVNAAIYTKFNTMYPVGIIAQTLRLFGQGMKVAVEITAMAADAGLIPLEEEIISIAGSHRGADTAIVIKPEISRKMFDIEIREIITKPRSI